jgi:hypothetical protein
VITAPNQGVYFQAVASPQSLTVRCGIRELPFLTVLLVSMAAAVAREAARIAGAGVRHRNSGSIRANAATTIAIDVEESAALNRLRTLMESDRIYREEGFSIAKLAGRLPIPREGSRQPERVAAVGAAGRLKPC